MIGDIPRQTPQVLSDVIVDAGLDVRARYDPNGHLVALKIDGVCPGCAQVASLMEVAPPHGTAWISVPSRRLRCGGICAANGMYSGVDARGRPIGLPFAKWTKLYVYSETQRAGVAPPLTVSLDEADRGAVRAIIEQAIAASQEPGIVAIAHVGPCGAGKTDAVCTSLGEQRRGLFLAPSHALASEHAATFEKITGQSPGRMRGAMRQLAPIDQAVARLWQDWGWNPLEFRRRAGLHTPRSIPHDEDLLVGVHEHLPLLAVLEEEFEDFDIPRPIIVDERPSLLECRVVPVEHFAFIAGQHVRPDLRSWCEPRAALANHIVAMGQALAERRRGLSRSDARYPDFFSGPALLRLFIETAKLPAKLGLKAAYQSMIWNYNADLDAYRCTLPCPLPPATEAIEGRLTPQQWPHGDFDVVTAALLEELSDPLRESQRPSGVCMVVKGFGDDATVEVQYRAAWGARVPSTHSVVILDATAGHLLPAIRASWPNHDVRVLSLTVLPLDADGTKQVWFKSSSYSRGELLTARGTVKRKRGAPALARLLRMAAAEVSRALGLGKSLGVIAPKPVAELLIQAHAVAVGAAGPGELARAQEFIMRKGAERLVGEFKAMLGTGAVARFHFGWQGNVRGTNDFEKKHCDALLTFPYTPNIGAVAEDARVLGVDATEYQEGLRDAELEQEWGRLRTVRSKTKKLLLHVDRCPPHQWVPTRVVTMPTGGPIPRPENVDAQRLASDLATAVGAVSPAFIRWIAAHPSEFRETFEDIPATEEVGRRAVVAARLPGHVLARAVREETRGASLVSIQAPQGGRAWRMREVRPGAASGLSGNPFKENVDAAK